MAKPKYWILKRVYSEKVAKGNSPWVWVPMNFDVTTIPLTKLEWRQLMKRIVAELGEGTYRIMRSQFSGENNVWKPVVYFEVLNDARFRIVRRYTQYKAVPGKKQPFFKEWETYHCFDPPRISNVLDCKTL